MMSNKRMKEEEKIFVFESPRDLTLCFWDLPWIVLSISNKLIEGDRNFLDYKNGNVTGERFIDRIKRVRSRGIV